MNRLYDLCCVASLITTIYTSNITLSFLNRVPRFSNSLYWDSYYSCVSIGHELQWEVNNISLREYTMENIGQIRSGATTTFHFISTLLSLQPTSDGLLCFYSILIVSAETNIDFNVRCGNGVLFNSTFKDVNTFNVKQEVNNALVFLEHVVSPIALEEDKLEGNTNIFVCGSNNQLLTWQVNGSTELSVTIFDNIGLARQLLQENGYIVEQQVIFIDTEPYSLVTAFFVTNHSEFSVRCGYPSNFVQLVANKESTPTPMGPTASTNDLTRNPIITSGIINTDSLETTFSDKDDNRRTTVAVSASIGAFIVVLLLIIIIIGCILYMNRKKCNIYKIKNNTRNVRRTYIQTDEVSKSSEHVDSTSNLDDQEQNNYSTPIRVKDFLHVMETKSASDIHKEFDVLKKSNPSKAALKEKCTIAYQHMEKNRYEDAIPYDWSLVKLRGSDYINASYIKGLNTEKDYITTQIPNSDTMSDFWMMILEHKVTVIVILKNEKAHWLSRKEYSGPSFRAIFKKVSQYAYFDIWNFEVQNQSNTQETVHVTLYHFLCWKKGGNPESTTHLTQLLYHIKSKNKRYSRSSPLVAGSEGGSGRTGVFIALDALSEVILSTNQYIGVFDFVKKMRENRHQMVNSKEQYEFIYRTLKEMILCGNTSMDRSELYSLINGSNSSTNEEQFMKQFELLGSVSRKPTKKEQKIALKEENVAKNRNMERLPYDESRVIIKNSKHLDSDYINGSFVDGYRCRKSYIATQAPKQNTENEFWQMIHENLFEIIVFLGNLQEDQTLHMFWPSCNKPQMYGKLRVTLKEEILEQGSIERTIILNKKDNSEKLEVKFFQYEGQLEHYSGDSSSCVQNLIRNLEDYQKTKKEIVVMCRDGAGRTGAFISIHAMIERIKIDRMVDLFQFILLSRHKRADFVSKLKQYIFCHQVLSDYFEEEYIYDNITIDTPL